MKSAPPETTAASAGLDCSRCAQHLRPDWNYCPTCALPARPAEEVLSSQIRIVRRAAAEGAAARQPDSKLLRWSAAGLAAALVLGTAAVGVLLWAPPAARILLAGGPEPPEPAETPPPIAAAGGLQYVWVTVPGGAFKYGPPAEGKPWTGEASVPTFEILKYEVTNAQWMEYLQDHDIHANLKAVGMFRDAVPSNWPWGPKGKPPEEQEPMIPVNEESLPVRGVSFDQAKDFCLWLDSSGRQRGARLPREEEWEKAARGTDGRIYPWAGDFILLKTVPGGEKPVPGAVVDKAAPLSVYTSEDDVSPYGCLHMGGNVSEWTDLWGGSSPSAPGPWDRYRVIRGASFQIKVEDGAYYARTWINDVRRETGLSALDVGFRIARNAHLDTGGGSPTPPDTKGTPVPPAPGPGGGK